MRQGSEVRGVRLTECPSSGQLSGGGVQVADRRGVDKEAMRCGFLQHSMACAAQRMGQGSQVSGQGVVCKCLTGVGSTKQRWVAAFCRAVGCEAG